MKFPIHPETYDRLKKLNMLPDYVIKDEFIKIKETRMYHHYTIPPMDGFIGTIRLNEFKKSLEFDKSREEIKYFSKGASSRLIELEAEMSKAKHWQGDIRSNEIYVFAIPDEMETAIGLVWKQEDNGTTFIISPVELPHLQKYMEKRWLLMTITLKEFKKFADDNDILWFYNKPHWHTTPFDFDHKYNKMQLDEIRKNYIGDKPHHDNWLYALFGTPEEREKEREKLLNKKELQMNDKAKQQKHATIGSLTDALEVAADKLERLVSRVKGEPITKSESKDTIDHGEESLALFLDEYPKRIDILNERITMATSQLMELLF